MFCTLSFFLAIKILFFFFAEFTRLLMTEGLVNFVKGFLNTGKLILVPKILINLVPRAFGGLQCKSPGNEVEILI